MNCSTPEETNNYAAQLICQLFITGGDSSVLDVHGP